MSDPVYDLAIQGIRTLFLLGLPIVVAAAVAGTLISLLQSALSIPDPALAYAARLAAVLVTLYFLMPSLVRSLVALAELSLLR